MPGITNAELAAALQLVIAQVDAREDQLTAWQSGTATGGPYANGQYPIANLLGELGYYKSPARLSYEVGLLTTSADGALAQCLAAQADAEAAAADAEASATTATTQANAAIAKALEADTFRQQAANSEANALVHRNAASTSASTASTAATTATTARDVTTAARDAAVAARDAAQASATAAATFDPANFYTKTAADGRYLQLTNFTWANLGSKPSTFTPSAHTHVIADITGLQTALDGKQAAGSYVTTANFTWANLSGKPTTFTPSAHTHVIADVTGLQTALDGKQAAGSYAAASHTHTIANVTGLQTALDGKLALAGGTMTGNLTTSGNLLTTAGDVIAQHNGTAITAVGIVRPGVDAMIQLARTGSTVGSLPINSTANTTYIYTTGGTLRIGGAGNFVTLDNGGATFSSTVNLDSVVNALGGNFRIRSGGGDSAMGAYVGFRNNSDVERGWVGYGDGTSRMRLNNGIGDILIASSNNIELSGTIVRRASAGSVLHHASSSFNAGGITVSTATPSGGSDGDIWLRVI